jgi:hypothetical protein
MKRLFPISVLLLLTCVAVGRASSFSSPTDISAMVWEPPPWDFLKDGILKATVPREMLAMLRLSDLVVTLEQTKMEDVAEKLGGALGQRGDAGEFDEWLCFHGADPGGPWVLWLESGEIDGGRAGSFQWHRLERSAVFDPRCRILAHTKVALSIPLELGITKADVMKRLGRPTEILGDRLIYVHEHQESIRGEPYDSTNIVSILIRDGRVWEIEVSKTTSS